MIPGGYILQPRCFGKSDAAHFPPVARELWFYLLREVNHTDNGKFKRGQGFFSLDDVRKDLSWMVGYRLESYSKPQLTKALRRLREGNMIATAKATRGVFVTVCNYDEYQNPENYEGNGGGSTKEPRRKSGGRTKNKNVKNEKNGISKPDILSQQTWEDLLLHRKNKKAPLTPRSLNTIVTEITKSVDIGYTTDQCIDEMTNRNWTGFKAEWMANSKTQPEKSTDSWDT